jgi:hypothetical protein
MSGLGEAKKRHDPDGENAVAYLAALLARPRSLWTCSSLAHCDQAPSVLAREA